MKRRMSRHIRYIIQQNFLFNQELKEFNTLTNSEIWTKVRAMSNAQILNSRTGTGQSTIWMEITGKVLAERLESPFSGPTTDIPNKSTGLNFGAPPGAATDYSAATTSEAIAFAKQRDDALRAVGSAKQNIAKFKSRTDTRGKGWYNQAQNNKSTAMAVLRRLSNQYRNPNNFIRTQALALRRILQTL